MNYNRRRGMGDDGSDQQIPAVTNDPNESVLLKQYRALSVQVSSMAGANKARTDIINDQQARMNQGIGAVRDGKSLNSNFKSALPDYMVPGNLGDVNRVIWPFWFTLPAPELTAAVGGVQVQGTSTFTVTQEAAFVMTSMSKAVFSKVALPVPHYTYIDADQAGATGKTPGLSCVFSDVQSGRFFMSPPMNLDHIGYSRFPTELPPMLLLPNSTMRMQYFNSDPNNTYVPFITFFGYRCRIEDAEMLLSLVRR